MAGLASETFVPVANGVAFSGVLGRYLEIQTVLSRDTGVTVSPILYDLTAADCPTFEVVFGATWDLIDLQGVLDQEYGVGVINDGVIFDGLSGEGATAEILLPAGVAVESSEVSLTWSGAPTVACRLERAVPNPFNPSTRIDFVLASSGRAELGIYDLGGRLVRRFDLGTRPAGPGSVQWNGRDLAGHGVASGIYVVRLRTPTQRDQMRIALIK